MSYREKQKKNSGDSIKRRCLHSLLRGQHGVSTGSGSDWVCVAISGTSHNHSVATALGIDLILKLGHNLQHVLHDSNLGALAAVDIGREVEQHIVLARACGVDQ